MMYPSTLPRNVELKSGNIIPGGTPVFIRVPEEAPSYALIYDQHGDAIFKMRSKSLYKVFKDEFINPATVDMDEVLERGVAPSLRGEDVEFDGVDPEGFPSVLKVLGLC